MKLEDEIKSTRFESAYQKSMVNLIFTYNWMSGQIKKKMSKYHVTTQQFNVLRILRGQCPNPSTVNLIRERMLDKMSDASRIVDRLIQKGLVTRCTSQADRRAVDIMISDKGLKLLKKMDEEIKGDEIIKDNLTEKEATQLNDLLDKLRG